MMDWKTRILALLLWLPLVLSSIGDENAEQRIVCYYTNWSVYRPGTAKFSPQNINPYLCTHLIYAFGGFTKDNTLKPFDKYQDIEKGGYAKFTGLKTYNKNLKTMLAIGGWNEGSSRFSPMVADPGRRKEFVKNSVKFLRQNHFDGLDLDWEYPAFRDGGKPRDRDNYADLVQELREQFDRESSKTGRPRLLLSMAVPAGIEYIDKGYDVPRLNEYLDFMNLLSYDYHSAYEPAANHHSPLYPLEEDNEYNYDSELTIDFTIEHLLKNGASPEKIVLGIPTYGRSYTLFNEDATDIGSPADGPGEEGDATREKGYLAYYEICESIAKSDEWEVVQPNPSAMGPYAYRGNQWVGYDDEDIVRIKARYVNEKKLGGIMFWSIDNDDFRGKCHGRPYPLIEAAKEAMLAGNERSNSGTKTKLPDNGKKPKLPGGQRIQGNTIGRKLNAGRRTTTTESSSTRRKVTTSRTNGRSNGRANGRINEDNEASNENEEEEEGEVNVVKSVEKPRSGTRGKNTRSRNRLASAGRKKQQNSRHNDDDKKTDSSGEETRSNKFTTPEPPTTPDPGSDFKCEDEGFFSHPRDCKKYFWCLDSGPSGLGIVGHQFTCPSGLVFNKAADSCDYPRNVVCPKTKTSQSTVTTTRAPITAATSRTTYLHKPTQRTTTPKSESEEEEYEYYDDDEDENVDSSLEAVEEIRTTTTARPYKTINRSRPTTTTSAPITKTTEASTLASTRSYKTTIDKVTSFEDEEDPRVIKELIDLIKKAGGIEQLEKQLHYQEKTSGGSAATTEENGRSTPATISRSLYERVLNRQAARRTGGILGTLSTTQSSKGDKVEQSAPKNSRNGFVNGPGGAQFEGLDNVPEVKNLRRTTKHQYVTIDRQRQSTSESPNDDDEAIDDEYDGDNKDVASSEDRAVSNPPQQKTSNRRVTPSYVNIRRPRPSTTTSENDVEIKDDDEENSDDSEEDEEKDKEEEEEPVTQRHRIVKPDEGSASQKSRYTNTQRFRSTTLRNGVDKVTDRTSPKDDSTRSTTMTSTTTTTVTALPVTEEISEISIPLSTTLQPDSSIDSKLYDTTRTYETTIEETSSSTVNPETTTTSNDDSLKLVENSATEILLTTVPASSISSTSNHETFTREPSIPAISQPRPFGFPRRGSRPTSSVGSTTVTTPTVISTVTEQPRSKVDSASLRLPTLKELVGLTTSLSGQVSSTSEFIQVSSTTNRVVDKTTDINVSRDDDQLNDRGYQKNPTDNDETLPAGRSNNYSDFHDSPLDTKIEREIFDNDILGSEEIQRRSSSAWYDKLRDDEQTRRTFNNEENVAMNEKSLERVELPVKILDHKNGEEIAKLVLLRSPESKLNSAILKPVLRIKIIDHESDKDRETGLQRINDFVKMENSSESSRENELYDNFRSTSAGKRRPIVPSTLVAVEEINDDRNTRKDNPRKRQRIVKARRRTRPIVAKDYSDEKITNVRDDESASFRAQNVRRIAGNGENTIVTLSNTTTIVPEFLDNFSTTVRATTIRGNHSNILKFSNVTRGFYVTKNIDETSSVPDDEVSNSTDFTQSTRKYSSKVENDLLDYSSTQEIDLKTEKMDVTTEKMYFTTEKIDFTTQIDETVVTTSERSYSTADESSIDESTITMSSEISLENTNENVSMEDRQFTTKKLETVTSDYVATVNDIFDQSSGLHVTTTEEKAIHEPAVTTFHPWTSIGLVATTEPTISIESTTSEYTPDDGTEILDKYTVTMVEETTENGLETLKTSENNHWRTSTIMESKSTIVPPVKSVSSRDDKLIESQTKRSKVEIPIKSMSIASDENNTMTTYRTKEIETKNTSVPIKGTFDENNEKYASQTEKSVRRQTNLHGKATTYKVAFNRGGTRYVASSKSISSVGSSLGSRGQSRRTTESFIDNDHYENNVTSEKVLPVTSTSSTESYDRVIKSTVIDESTSSPNSRSSSRVRNNARKTTISFDIDKTGSNTFDQGELPLTRPATTEAYNKTTKKIVSGETTYLTMNLGKGTPSPAENLRSSSRAGYDDVETTRSFETNKTRVNDTTAQEELPATSVSSTESYDKTFEITASGESTYLTTNFVEEASSHSDDSISSSWVHGNALKTTIFFETDDKTESNELDENESSATSSTTTQAYDKTTMSKEVTYTTQNFDESTESDSPNLASSSPRYLVNHESTNNSSVPNESFTMITSTESNDKILEQTTLTSPTNYLTTNFVESTESDDLSSQNFELNVKTIRSYEMTDNTSNDSKIMEELPVTSSKSSEIYEKTIKSTTVRMDYPTTSFIEKNDDRFYPTTMQDQTEAYDQMIDTTNSPNTIMTEETVRSEDNLTESRESNETTASYDKNSLSWLYDRRNNIIDDRKTELPFTSNDATMENVKLESFETTTATYPSTDLLEFIANTDETHTRMNNQTMPAVSGEFIDEITKTMNPSDEKNYVTTEPNDLSITTTLASTIYENMMLTTTSTDANDAEKIHSSVKGYSSSNATFINNARSTTPIYEKHSTIDTSTNFVTPIIELPIKRTRGRVRFTNFAGNNDDANEQNRRTVKQVVVRRRLAKDRHRNVTTAERNFIETEKNLTSEINQNIKNEKIKNKSVNDQNVEIKSIINEKTKIEDVTSDKEKNENVKIVNTKNFRTRTNDRVSEEKINSTKSTRRRVVVYRGRPRSEKIVTTPTTTTSTTTVQSSSLSSDDFTENRTRRRGKWRKRIVLKRSRINAEEDEDQSIAETGDFERALIDDDDDELVGDFRDELGSSYVVIPPEVVKSSNHEDISEEVNLFKNSGAFLRRPGTLVRNEAIGRLRPKSPNTSGPTTLLASKIAPFSRIQSVDPTYEIKTNDQSVRAQELAVTLADPPAIRSTSTTGSGRVGLRKKETTRKISTTIAPRTEEATTARTTPFVRRRQNNRTRNENLRIIETPVRTRRPAIIDYDYYVDDEIRLVLKPELKDKIFVTRKGGIRCLDQGNFAHPTSCKKFITCARMVNGQVIGTEYTCPAKLSFDPVGGICNWSAGLGCEEISKSSN